MKSHKDTEPCCCKQFLRKYNPGRTLDEALDKAINASVQLNPLYKNVLDPDIRRARNIRRARSEAVRRRWKAYLIELIPRYKSKQCVSNYERDIENLKQLMNKEFLRNDESGAFRPPGFRISHAQKSISVFLKHLWCMCEVATPPQCPVDRQILEKARCPDPRWTYVNSICEHRKKIRCLEEAKAKDDPDEPLAKWELRQFADLP